MYRTKHSLLNLTIKNAGQVILLLASAFMLQACCKCEREFGGLPGSIPAHLKDNRPPVLRPIYAMDRAQRLRVIRHGDVVTVRANATDPDGDTLDYFWRVDDDAGSVDEPTAQEVRWEVGTAGALRVTVYDRRGGEAQSYISVSAEDGVVFSGQVLDGDGKPLGDAKVEVEGHATRTDADGRFRLVIPDSRANRLLLNIRKDGYGLVSRVVDNGVINGDWTLRGGTVSSFDPTQPITIQDTNSQNCGGSLSEQIDWTQFPRQRAAQIIDANGNVNTGTPPPSIQAALAILSAGTPCSPGIGLNIPANSLVDGDGNVPPGNVSVAVTTVDIYGADEMPGDYTVRAPDGDSTFVMQSFGAGTVEAFVANQRYHLRAGAKATLTIPVDPTQRTIAGKGKRRKGLPAVMPMLTYNEVRGEWMQQTLAVLNEDESAYVAGIDHFSAFNSDLLKQDQSCVRIDASAIPGSFKLEVTIPIDNAAPVVRVWDVGPDDSQPNQNLHAIYNLPNDIWIAMVPIRVETSGDLTPLGTFVVDTGGAQFPTDPNRPVFDFGACQSEVALFEVGPANIVVDATGRHFGPLPAHTYALLDEVLGDNDFYPLMGTGIPGSFAESLFALFDTGSTMVAIHKTTPYTYAGDPDNGLGCVLPHRLTDANWFAADTEWLGLQADATARVRLSGLDGSSAIFNNPDVEIPTVNVRRDPSGPTDIPLDVSLMGAPVTQRTVALIDYTSRLTVAVNFYPDLDDPANTNIPGFTLIPSIMGPDITFYAANDTDIPFPQLFVSMERFGTTASRWVIHDLEFQNGAAVVSGSSPRNFLFDTATTITRINSDVASGPSGLGLVSGNGSFDCLGGTNNGFEIDAVVMTGPDGSYTVQNAAVCWDTSLDGPNFDAVTGASLFDQLALLVDGPRDRIGIGTPSASPVNWVNPPRRVCQ